MIVGSIVFVLIACVFLVFGVVNGDEVFYYLSVVASALAALALVVGVRHRAQQGEGDELDEAATAVRGPTPRLPRQASTSEATQADVRLALTSPDPPDEPAEQSVSALALARIARLDTQVAVIDGRPRMHVLECLHLLGRDYERLAVSEALELGFTPCGLCTPVTVLLAAAPRG